MDRREPSMEQHVIDHGHLALVHPPCARKDYGGSCRSQYLLKECAAPLLEDVFPVQRVQHAVDVEEHHGVRATCRGVRGARGVAPEWLRGVPAEAGVGLERRHPRLAHLMLARPVPAEAEALEHGPLHRQDRVPECGATCGAPHQLPPARLRGRRRVGIPERVLELPRLRACGEAPLGYPPQVPWKERLRLRADLRNFHLVPPPRSVPRAQAAEQAIEGLTASALEARHLHLLAPLQARRA
mmetsp:Transcript_75818/g.239860  ORF Transcript_75818/g.239860 Transcript_75818/m.239860 type:complete len:241 (+) Transcript_75818:994-1716(+)